MRVLVIVLVVAAVALSAAVYPRLPERVPVHWNLDGEIDGTAPKAYGAFLLPGLIVVLALIFSVLPRISPAGFDIEENSRAYRGIVGGVLFFLFAMHAYMILAALNIHYPINAVITALTGALFVIMGNYLPKVRRNFFIGIRTPWTLADEDVWYRTHRLGGGLFVIAGILLMVAGPFIPARATTLLIAVVIVAAVITVIYSFITYRRPPKEETETMKKMLVLLFAILFVSLPLIAAPREEAAELKTASGTLHGTLLLPDAKGRVPVVLIIAGSGPTDRNGNSAILSGPNDSLKMLAEGLAAKGIASLRYDKRGIGESRDAMTAEKDLRFTMYVDDAAAWASQLKSDSRFSRVIIAGHSEGSLLGIVAAQKGAASGLVSVSGISHSADQTIRAQLAGKLPPELADFSEKALVALKSGKEIADVPTPLMMLYRPSVQPYLVSWFQYDPSAEIAKVKVPVLIVQGTTDMQVPVEDARALAKAKPDARLEIIEGMNHVLKTVESDPAKQMASYSDAKLPTAPKAVDVIAEFVKNIR